MLSFVLDVPPILFYSLAFPQIVMPMIFLVCFVAQLMLAGFLPGKHRGWVPFVGALGIYGLSLGLHYGYQGGLLDLPLELADLAGVVALIWGPAAVLGLGLGWGVGRIFAD